MSHNHPETHETRLAEILAESDPVLAFRESELATCEECTMAVEELQTTLKRLRNAGSLEREELEWLASSTEIPGERAAIEALRGEILGGGGRVHRVRWISLVAAAAAVLAFFLMRPGDEGVVPFDPNVKLGSELEILGPVGVVESYDVFRWSGEAPAGGYFRVRVHDENLILVEQSGQLSENSWSPTKKLPDRIFWWVETFGPDDPRKVIDEASESAERSF